MTFRVLASSNSIRAPNVNHHDSSISSRSRYNTILTHSRQTHRRCKQHRCYTDDHQPRSPSCQESHHDHGYQQTDTTSESDQKAIKSCGEVAKSSLEAIGDIPGVNVAYDHQNDVIAKTIVDFVAVLGLARDAPLHTRVSIQLFVAAKEILFEHAVFGLNLGERLDEICCSLSEVILSSEDGELTILQQHRGHIISQASVLATHIKALNFALYAPF